MDNFTIHYTKTEKLQGKNGSGWEFSCKECSYRVRYIYLSENTDRTLEIINIGDPTARHTNNSETEFRDQELPRPRIEANAGEDKSAWLTSDLLDQIQAILAKFDWD